MTQPFQSQILAGRTLIRLEGENVLGFLHNVLSSHVESLARNACAYGALLSPQGKIQHDVFVHRHDDAIYLDCVRAQRETLLKRLTMYRLRSKFSITPEDRLAVFVSPEAGQASPDPRYRELGTRKLVKASSDEHSNADYHRFCISLGIADGDFGIGENELFPHEANFDLLHGVSFTKGCYIGQEVVSRMQHRGTARTRILPVAFDGAAPSRNSDVTSGETRIGTVLATSGNLGLALMRLDRLAEAQEPLLTGSGAVHVRKPDWMTIDLVIPQSAR